MRNEHLIDLYYNGNPIGCGLRIERTFALTAVHLLCEKIGADACTTKPSLHLEDGTPVSIVSCNTPSDLARLRIELNGSRAPLSDITFRKARDGEAWWATASAAPNKPFLSGKVVEVDSVYYKTATLTVKAMRLRCEVPMDDHATYAGSPIESTPQSSPPEVLGLLVQPRGNSSTGDEAFAVSIAEAFRLLGSRTKNTGMRPSPGYIRAQWILPGNRPPGEKPKKRPPEKKPKKRPLEAGATEKPPEATAKTPPEEETRQRPPEEK
ncbi:hypothetical protein [Streptomyces sp. NPDC001401]|uniref:hypothetical protein n=1 Tax=Streptomyces sp. NPDC001401 TaxID=3364570 RepID=UPI0036BC18B4